MAKKQSPSTLLWFIRRKSYVPLCEIRRRFDLDGDDGAFLNGESGARIFVGLPSNTTSAVEKLWRQGKIGLELSVEFDCRVLIGVYPISPVRELNGDGVHYGHGPAHVIDMPEPHHVIDMPEPHHVIDMPEPPHIVDMPDPVEIAPVLDQSVPAEVETPPHAMAAGE